MDIKYIIRKKPENKIVAQNLSDEYLHQITIPFNKTEIAICPISGKKMRHGSKEFIHSSIYLVSYDNTITNKIFNRYFDACSFFMEHLINSYDEINKKESRDFRRLRHNLITYNTNIVQELEKTFYTDGAIKGASNQIKYVKEVMLQEPDEVALSILKIYKSSNLMKSDFAVFDILNTENPFLDFDSHQIHKVTLSVIRPFWLDLLEKEINIQISEFVGSVTIDYKSISVVYTHLFDNIVKYIMPKSDLSIRFQNNGPKTWVIIEMTSMKITERDKLKIFDEGYSGEIAKESSNSGDGIGMFIAKRLMTLNKGIIRIKTDINPMRKKLINNIPYETNQVILEFISRSN